MDTGEHDLCDLGHRIAGEIGRLAEQVEDAVGPAPEREGTASPGRPGLPGRTARARGRLASP